MKILVFIPCYQCGVQLVRTLAQFTPDVAKHFAHILVVDNGSKDNTLLMAEKKLKEIDYIETTLVQNTLNYHLGGSHKVAFKFAQQHGYSHVCVLHGDDQGRISDLLDYLPLAAQDERVSWLGSRFCWGARLSGYGIARIVGNLGFNALFSIVTARWLSDLGSGLNLFSVKGLQRVNMNGFGDNLMFNYYLILAMCFLKSPYRYFPISWREDDQVSNVKLFSHGYKTLGLLGAFLRSPSDFVTTDHRAIKHDDYSWNVVYNAPAKGNKK